MKTTTHSISTLIAIAALIAVTPSFATASATTVYSCVYQQVIGEDDIAQYLHSMNLNLLRYRTIEGSEDILVDTVEGIRLYLYVKEGVIINSNEVPIE